MKFTQSLLFALPFLQSAVAQGGGMVAVEWSVENVTEAGLSEIFFPMDISGAPRKEGFYFAQQFGFVNQPAVGYTGLQPRPDVNGLPVIHGVFSSFNPGTTSDDPNCSDGADGGSGVSCAVEIVGSYDHEYQLHIKNTEGTKWVGTLVDIVMGNSTQIGSYTLAPEAKGIQSYQMGFVELYAWNDGKEDHVCSDVPKQSVVFGAPISKGYTGTVGKPYEYGDCVGESQFETHEHSDGSWSVTVGW
ncbi:uncharacterized protein N7479_005555 [Penicillium vulpinum]|uniref:Ubiquitin 3 binding protein But2 C-terminal domain-containing protein n=1 Tax=Penicillium vulpinum TaxID=29845 RepID=A0A1V6SEZ6_9EURO|nr:uncharacterized protein N7479_005555 [Penicillium vulpinum]KAJ5958405.1 hypothetical protein N7479_005555 [Penicillium vulpinum]OQE12163.1 hypothetical protein PENVUL_c001G07064 [Penicillium vulpinum]